MNSQPPKRPPSTVVPEVLPPEDLKSTSAHQETSPLPPWLSRQKVVFAFLIAAISDALSIWFQLILPVQLALDMVTAILLFVVLGWRWPLLLGLIMEAIPGLAIFPAWVLVVGAIVALGRPRPNLR